MKKKSSSCESTKPDRKTVERNRRLHMKGLCFKLGSLIPQHHCKTSKEVLSQQDQLEQAAIYIKHLKERIEKLESKKELAMKSRTNANVSAASDACLLGTSLPVVELREWDSGLEISLISGTNKNFMLYQVINILEEQGAEVVSASFSTVGEKVFHTLHAQVKISRVGIETSRVCERLQELLYTNFL